jgi:Peroxisome biogenesis factor 1, N-terminal
MVFLSPVVSHTLKVEVGLLYDLPKAKSVATEPLTSDDWEILVCMRIYVTSRLVPHLFLRNYMQST